MSATSRFPETTIISISTHGEIRLTSDIANISDIVYDTDGIATVLPTFNINPHIQEFYKYNAVVPGVVNYIQGSDAIDDPTKIEKISRSKGGYEAYDLLLDNNISVIHKNARDIISHTTGIDAISREISEYVTNYIASMITSITAQKKDLDNKKEPLSTDELQTYKFYTDFINNAAKGSRMINCLKGSRKMINKTFVLLPENISPTNEEWTITCLNDPFNAHRSIFDDVYNAHYGVSRSSVRLGRRSITLEQVVNYLANNGVVRLMIIDLTCNLVYGPYDDDLSVPDIQYVERTSRMFRRGVLGNIGYGGKKRKYSRANKISTTKSKNHYVK